MKSTPPFASYLSRPLAPALALYAALTLTSMALMSIGAAIVAVAWLADRESRREAKAIWKEIFSTRVTRLLAYASLAVFVTWVASLVSARIAPLTFGERTLEVSFSSLGKAWYLAWPFVLAMALRSIDERARLRVLQFWLVTFGVLSFVGLQQFFTGLPRGQANPQWPGYFHPTLLLGHHLSVSNVWVFPFFFSLSLLFPRAGECAPPVVGRRWLVAFSVAGLLVLLLGFSRALWLGLPLGILVFLVASKRKVLAVSAVAALALVALGAMQLPSVQNRIHTMGGRNERIELWRVGEELWKRRPWFGVGLAHTPNAQTLYYLETEPGRNDYFVGHMHSLYLESLVATGIVGAIAFAFFLAVVTWLFAQAPWSLGAWVVFLVGGLTQVNLWEGKVFHQFCFVLAIAIVGATKRKAP